MFNKNLLIGAVVALWAMTAPSLAAAATADDIKRGAYLVRAGGCVACHTDIKGKGPEFAGGHALATPYGTFYSPNITPDKETGIGKWSDEDFVRAMREGVSPDGDHYYPTFPYPTYTKMRDADMRAIKAYLFTIKPIRMARREHDVGAPFGWRFLMGAWKMLNFIEGEYKPDPTKSAQWNRGAYLVDAVAHCGECHTPRGEAGAVDLSMYMAGTNDGPENKPVPNITPDDETGIGKWDVADLVQLMKTGLKPNYDDVEGIMDEAVQYGLKHMTDEDLTAMAVYLKSIKSIPNQIGKAKK
jgi:mono/diheme cytochrome c family protein